MSHYWLLVTFSWIGSVSLQYINTGGPGAESILDNVDPTARFPLPYLNNFNLRNEYEPVQNDAPMENYHHFYHREDFERSPDLLRKRRTIENESKDEQSEKHWLPNLLDTDQTSYIQNVEPLVGAPFILQGLTGLVDANSTDVNILNEIEKKSFSPWGGKRDKPLMEHMWTWKRAAIREPSMPKRVRFSPWGGKRSGQLIYKPGVKGSKFIFSSYLPELTRIISKYSPNGNRLNLAGIQFLPSLDKRHPVRILAISTKMGDKASREAMPFNAFMENIPKIYKPGHPYVDINLKKDGKRKVKFSAWGGKRSPPIIGPIWTPSSQNIKDTTLDAILLIRNSPEVNDKTTKAD